MTTEGEKHFGNKLLVGVLIFLAVVIIGLVAGIVVVKLQQNEDLSQGEITKSDDEITDEILAIIRPMTIEDSEKYLDEKLEEYKDTGLEFRIKMMKINVYVNGGYSADAIVAAADIDEDRLNNEDRMEYYMALNKAYRALGDEEEANYYRDKYFTIYDEVYGGGGGDDYDYE